MSNKKCYRCKQFKLTSEFNVNRTKKDGLHNWCKVCSNERSIRWYKENKNDPEVIERNKQRLNSLLLALRSRIDELKSFLGCCVCGEKESCCLDFHHKHSKNKEVSFWVRSKSPKKVYEEVLKCVCVCANCHRKIHSNKIGCPDDNIKEEVAEKFLGDYLIKKRRGL